MKKECYVLFENHQNGLRLYQELKNKEISAAIVPTPRALSSSCGISLKIRYEDQNEVKACAEQKHIAYIKIEAIEKIGDKMRDRYC